MASTLKVLITVQFAPELVEQIEAVSPRLVVTTIEAKEPGDVPEDAWLEAQILYTHKVLPEPDQAPELKWIQFHRAGNEAFMEASILRKAGLEAASMSGASAPQVAEYVLGMILALGHRLPQLIEHQRRAVLATKQDAMRPADGGYMLEGVGDPAGDFLERLYPAEALNSMLKECDYVVVCVPLTNDSQGLIGKTQLEKMKAKAFLVDVSRGGVVNQADLILALEKGKIAGAALDVYPEEPLPEDNLLWKMPNVILTPHIAGVSRVYNSRAVDLFAANLERYLDGKQLLNLIDLQRGY